MAPTPGRSSIGVRVRPNANSFITDLSNQLRTKKKTFYVDVHANLKPANKEIREWAATLKDVRATVPISAGTAKATNDMAVWRQRQRTIKTNVPVGVNLAGAYANLLTFRKLAAKPIEVELKVNAEAANKAAERFQQAIARRGISMPLNLDRTTVHRTAQKIDSDLVQRLKNQGGILLPVEADLDPAETQIQSFTSRPHPNVQTQLDVDLKQARLDLTRLRAEQLSRKMEIRVDVKKSSLQRVQQSFNQIEKSTGNFNFIRSLDFGPVNLGKPSGLVGTLTTITALAGAVPGAATAVMGLSQALMDLVAAGALVPGVIGGILASMSTFSVGISGVGDAFEALTEMWTETPHQAAQSARRSAQAHNQLRQAVREEAQAQRDVGSARREATNDLRSLNNELRGSVLNEAQAILDLQKARDRLAQGNFENTTDMRQAQLDEAKAVQNVINVRERNAQLQVKANEESAKGVEGSDKVQDALERQTRAAEQATMAMEAIASTQATSALGKFQQELDQLTPNARDFIMTLAGMKGEFEGLRNMVQETMFADTGSALREMIGNLMPIIGPGMQQIAQGINQNILQFMDTVGSPQGQSIIERIMGGTAEAQKAMSGLIDPLVRGFGTLMAAGAEHLPQLVSLFTRLADRFANFIETADESGALDAFLDRGIGALESMFELGTNLIQIVFKLGEAFDGNLLQSLVNVTQKFEDWIDSAKGQEQLNEWIREAKEVWESWKPVLQDLPRIFGQVSEAARNVLTPVLAILDKVTNFLADNPRLVGLFVSTWLGAKVLVGAASPIVQLAGILAKVVSAITKLPGLMAKIPGLPIPGLPGVPGVGKGGAPVPPIIGGPWAAAGPAATVAIPTIAGNAIANAVTGQDVPVPTAIADAATAPKRIFQRVFGEGTDQDRIDKINERYKDAQIGGKPVPAYTAAGRDAAQALIGALVEAGSPAGLWVSQASDPVDQAKRYAWVFGNNNPDDIVKKMDFTPPTSYMQGGYTDWGVRQGKIAELHGGEYVEPHDVVEHYGVGAMKAIHEKRVPKEFLGSFWPGGPVPLHPFGPPPGPVAPDTPTPSAPVSHGPPQVGATPINAAPVPGLHGTVGPAPGPVETTPGVQPTPMDPSLYGPMASPESSSKLNIMGIEIPLGGIDATRGWGEGGPPVGLGGGDGFDIRRFGIGPGPVGSGPADWMNFTGGVLGNFLTGTVGALGRGLLGAFGLEGILGSPYFSGATGLLSHFLNPNQTGVGQVQAPGADATNAAVANAVGTYYQMPVNPVTGAPAQIPGVFDASGALMTPSRFNESGLQPHTTATLRAVSAAFPGIPNVGGYREDPLPDHPSGRGLDIAIPNWETEEGKAYGDQVNSWLQANASSLGIDATIWRDTWHRFRDGATSPVGGHQNHIHVQMAKQVPESVSGMLTSPYGSTVQPGAIPTSSIPGVASTGIPEADALDAAMRGVDPSTPPQGNGPLRIPRKTGQVGTTSSPGLDKVQGSQSGFSMRQLQQGVANYSGNPLGDPIGGKTGPSMPTKGDRTQLKNIARQMYIASGMPPAEWPAFERLIQKESSWDPEAKNPTSTAFGLGQFLDTTQAQYGITGVTNPVSQLAAIFKYIGDRYDGSPAKALSFHNRNNWYDRGGWLMPGQSTVDNATGKPELVVPWDALPSFLGGGYFNAGAVQPRLPEPPKKPRPPAPRGPDIQKIQPAPPPMQPKPAPIAQPAPPPVTHGPPPGQAPVTTPGVANPTPTVTPARIGTGPGVGQGGGNHLHPAVQKGIQAGAATLGSLADSAVAAGTMGATMGAGAAAGMGGMGGGLSASGVIKQAGKIVEGIANVGASFLVGTLSQGTTENPYGVTQRASNPTGGTRVVDNSQRYGDVYTQNPREFFKQLDLRDAQRAQGSLAGYDRYA